MNNPEQRRQDSPAKTLLTYGCGFLSIGLAILWRGYNAYVSDTLVPATAKASSATGSEYLVWGTLTSVIGAALLVWALLSLESPLRFSRQFFLSLVITGLALVGYSQVTGTSLTSMLSAAIALFTLGAFYFLMRAMWKQTSPKE